MPDPNVNTPPDVSAWTSAGGTAVETPAVAPETPIAPETPAATPETPETPVAPSPAEQAVEALVKGGLKQEDAQKLLDSVRTPEPIKDALEAFLDGKSYPVPKNLTFKLKSGTVERQATLDQLQREGMLATDYQRKTQELAQQRREHQRQVAEWTARDAALKEREKWFETQRNEMLEAQKDPTKWEQYQEILRLRQANPGFDKLFQDAMKAREDGATKEVFAKAMEEQQVASGAQQALEWIQDVASEFPTVNPERVQTIYAYALQRGELPVSREAVKQVFLGEQAYLKSGATEYERQMAEMKAEIEALKTGKVVETHNARTAGVLARAGAPNTAPAGGGPAAPVRVTPPKRIPPDRGAFDTAVSDWVKQRD